MEFYFYIDTKNSPIWQKYPAIESMERGLYCLNGVQFIKPQIRHSHIYRRAIPWLFLTWIRNIKNYVQKVNIFIRKRNCTIAKSAFQYHEWLICLNIIVVLPAFHNRINFQLNTCQCRTKHTSHPNNIYVFLRSAHDFIVFFSHFFPFKIYMKMDVIRELPKLLLMLLIALFHRPQRCNLNNV